MLCLGAVSLMASAPVSTLAIRVAVAGDAAARADEELALVVIVARAMRATRGCSQPSELPFTRATDRNGLLSPKVVNHFMYIASRGQVMATFGRL